MIILFYFNMAFHLIVRKNVNMQRSRLAAAAAKYQRVSAAAEQLQQKHT
jgi:hypothetical protein